jgi:hypothetical protein
MDLAKDESFQTCVANWEHFWREIHQNFVAQRMNVSEKPAVAFPFYQKLWPYHTTTVTTSMVGAKAMETLMAEEDRRFGLGWCGMVELLEAMSWAHLSLDSLMKHGASFLPSRRLDAETLEDMKENCHKEYMTCQNMFKLHDTSKVDMEKQCNFWKRLSGYDSVQIALPFTLEHVMNGNTVAKTLAILRLLAFAMLPQTPFETALWIATIIAAVAIMIAL